MPGIGKTALAVHWAHRVAGRFPDGQLHVALRGFDPARAPLDPAAALRGLLAALGVPPAGMPDRTDSLAGLYRSLLTGRRLLVVLDDAADTEQVRPLLPASPGCLTLVTSRHGLPGLIASGTHPLRLDLPSAADARATLAAHTGHDLAAAEPDAIDEIVTHCGRLPLALTIAATRTAGHPDRPLATVAAELRHSRGTLDAFAAGGRPSDARTAFAGPGGTPEARGGFGSTEGTPDVAADLADGGTLDVRTACATTGRRRPTAAEETPDARTACAAAGETPNTPPAPPTPGGRPTTLLPAPPTPATPPISAPSSPAPTGVCHPSKPDCSGCWPCTPTRAWTRTRTPGRPGPDPSPSPSANPDQRPNLGPNPSANPAPDPDPAPDLPPDLTRTRPQPWPGSRSGGSGCCSVISPTRISSPSTRRGRYAQHELLRVFAAELAETYDSPDDRRAARRRLFDHDARMGTPVSRQPPPSLHGHSFFTSSFLRCGCSH